MEQGYNTRLYNTLMGNPGGGNVYNAIGRTYGSGNVDANNPLGFLLKRGKSIENAIGTTLMAPVSGLKDTFENWSTAQQRRDWKGNIDDVYRKYGFRNKQDYDDQLYAAENSGNQAEADRLLNIAGLGDDLRNVANNNAAASKAKADDYTAWRTDNSYLNQKINQDEGKFLGSAINTLSTGVDLLGLGAGPISNAIQGGIEGYADELEQSGLRDFDWNRANQNALSGAVTGAATGAFNKALGATKFGGGKNLFKGSNKFTKGLNDLGSKTGLGRFGSTVATGMGRGALSGAVGGATGAGLQAALNKQDILGSAWQGALQGARGGAVSGGVMAGINMGINKTPFMRKVQEAQREWNQSGKTFSERLNNTLDSEKGFVGKVAGDLYRAWGQPGTDNGSESGMRGGYVQAPGNQPQKYVGVNPIGERFEYTPDEMRQLIDEYKNYKAPEVLSGNSSSEAGEILGPAGDRLVTIYNTMHGGNTDPVYNRGDYEDFTKWINDIETGSSNGFKNGYIQAPGADATPAQDAYQRGEGSFSDEIKNFLAQGGKIIQNPDGTATIITPGEAQHRAAMNRVGVGFDSENGTINQSQRIIPTENELVNKYMNKRIDAVDNDMLDEAAYALAETSADPYDDDAFNAELKNTSRLVKGARTYGELRDLMLSNGVNYDDADMILGTQNYLDENLPKGRDALRANPRVAELMNGAIENTNIRTVAPNLNTPIDLDNNDELLNEAAMRIAERYADPNDYDKFENEVKNASALIRDDVKTYDDLRNLLRSEGITYDEADRILDLSGNKRVNSDTMSTNGVNNRAGRPTIDDIAGYQWDDPRNPAILTIDGEQYEKLGNNYWKWRGLNGTVLGDSLSDAQIKGIVDDAVYVNSPETEVYDALTKNNNTLTDEMRNAAIEALSDIELTRLGKDTDKYTTRDTRVANENARALVKNATTVDGLRNVLDLYGMDEADIDRVIAGDQNIDQPRITQDLGDIEDKWYKMTGTLDGKDNDFDDMLYSSDIPETDDLRLKIQEIRSQYSALLHGEVTTDKYRAEYIDEIGKAVKDATKLAKKTGDKTIIAKTKTLTDFVKNNPLPAEFWNDGTLKNSKFKSGYVQAPGAEAENEQPIADQLHELWKSRSGLHGAEREANQVAIDELAKQYFESIKNDPRMKKSYSNNKEINNWMRMAAEQGFDIDKPLERGNWHVSPDPEARWFRLGDGMLDVMQDGAWVGAFENGTDADELVRAWNQRAAEAQPNGRKSLGGYIQSPGTTAPTDAETEVYRQLTAQTGNQWDDIAKQNGYRNYDEAVQNFLRANPGADANANNVLDWMDQELMAGKKTFSQAKSGDEIKYERKIVEEITDQFNPVSAPTKRSTRPNETFKGIYDELGLSDGNDIRKAVHYAEPGELIPTIIREAAGRAGVVDLTDAQQMVQELKLNKRQNYTKTLDVLEDIIDSTPSTISGGKSGVDALELQRTLEKMASDARGTNGTYRIGNKVVDQTTANNMMRIARNIGENLDKAAADTGAVQYALNRYAPELQEMKNAFQGNGQWGKWADDVASANSIKQLRNSIKNLTRASIYIEDGDNTYGTMGSRTARGVGINGDIPTTKRGLINRGVNAVVDKIESTPAARNARLKRYTEQLAKAKQARIESANKPATLETLANPTTPTDTTDTTEVVTGEVVAPQSQQLWNAIGRTEGALTGQQARTGQYLVQAANDTNNTAPTTGATYGGTTGTTSTMTTEQEKAKYFYPPTGQYWPDMLSQAMRNAKNAGDDKALGALYEMYQDAIKSNSSSENLTDKQRQANAAQLALQNFENAQHNLAYDLSDIPVVGGIANLGGNDYLSQAESLALQVGYMLSGATVNKDEARKIGMAYVPQPRDNEAVRRDKIQRLRGIISEYQRTN